MQILKKHCLWLLGLVVAQMLPASLMAEEASRQPEYKFKAGYLYNLTRFIEWPTNTAPAATNPILIGVMGDSNAVSIIEATLRDKRSKGCSFLVKPVTEVTAGSGCHVLFVTRHAAKSPADIRRDVGSAATLLVGETDQFAENGGMVGFVPQGDTFRLTLNVEATAQAGLRVSAKLANVALIVRTRYQQ